MKQSQTDDVSYQQENDFVSQQSQNDQVIEQQEVAKVAEFIKTVTEEINTDPYNEYSYIDRGNAYLSQGNYDLAFKDYNKAITLNPSNFDAYLGRGTLYEQLSKYDQAIDEFSIAIKLNPNDDYAFQSRGKIYYNYKQYPLAIKDFTKAIEINPKIEQLYNNRGQCYYCLGQSEEAIKDISIAIEMNPNIDYFYQNRGSSYYYLKNYELAIKDFEKAIELNPVQCIGVCREHLGGENDLIIENFSKVIKLEPDNVDLYYHRGSAYGKCNKIDLAIQDYSQILKLERRVSEAYFLRGELYQKKNELDLAINDYSIILKQNYYSEVYFFRGCIYTIQKKFDLAIQDYLKLEESKGFFPLNQINMGIIFIAQQKYYKAIMHLKKAFEQIQNEGTYYLRKIKENKHLINQKIKLLLEINKKLIEITEVYEKQTKLNIITQEQDQNFTELQNNIANTVLKELQNNYKDDVSILKNLLNLIQEEILILKNNQVHNKKATNSVSGQQDIFDNNFKADTLELYKLPENQNKLIYYKSFYPRLLTFIQACSLIQIDLFPQNLDAILEISKEELESEIQIASFYICEQIKEEELEPNNFQFRLIVSCIVQSDELEKIEHCNNLYWQLGIDHSLRVLKFIDKRIFNLEILFFEL